MHKSNNIEWGFKPDYTYDELRIALVKDFNKVHIYIGVEDKNGNVTPKKLETVSVMTGMENEFISEFRERVEVLTPEEFHSLEDYTSRNLNLKNVCTIAKDDSIKTIEALDREVKLFKGKEANDDYFLHRAYMLENQANLKSEIKQLDKQLLDVRMYQNKYFSSEISVKLEEHIVSLKETLNSKLELLNTKLDNLLTDQLSYLVEYKEENIKLYEELNNTIQEFEKNIKDFSFKDLYKEELILLKSQLDTANDRINNAEKELDMVMKCLQREGHDINGKSPEDYLKELNDKKEATKSDVLLLIDDIGKDVNNFENIIKNSVSDFLSKSDSFIVNVDNIVGDIRDNTCSVNTNEDIISLTNSIYNDVQENLKDVKIMANDCTYNVLKDLDSFKDMSKKIILTVKDTVNENIDVNDFSNLNQINLDLK